MCHDLSLEYLRRRDGEMAGYLRRLGNVVSSLRLRLGLACSIRGGLAAYQSTPACT